MNKITSLLDRIKTNFKKNKVATIVLICIWIITIVGTLFVYKDTLGKQSYGNSSATSVVALYDGATIKQTVPVIDKTESVAIKFATYARKNKGTLNVQVMGNNTRTIYATKDIDTKNLEDNAFLTIRLDKDILLDKEQFVTVTISSNNTLENAIGVYYSEDKVFEMSEYFVNGELQNGDLGVRFLTNSEPLTKYYKMLITWTITGITFLILFMMLVEPKLEIFFVLMATIIGITFCFLMTPLSIPDEFAHFEYSLQLSNYMTFEENHLMIDGDYKDYGSYMGHHNVSSAYEKIMRRWDSKFTPDGVMEEIDNDIDGLYTLCFVPQSLGVTIARLLKMNRVKLFFLGRLFNLAFYVTCVYIAIKKTPIHKTLFGIIATLPILMQQAASYSYDCSTNGLSILMIAYLLSFMYSKDTISNKEVIIVTIICALVSPIKKIYGLFSLLFWFVPSNKYKNKKCKIVSSLIICLPAIYELVLIAWPILARMLENISEIIGSNTSYDSMLNTISTDSTYAENHNIITVGYIVRHPMEIISIVLRTIRYSFKNWIYDAFGRTLSGMSIVIPLNLSRLLLLAPLLASLLKEKYVESAKFKVAIFALCIIECLLIIGGFLLSWTDLNQDVVTDFGGMIIHGIQGRYFCPLLPYGLSLLNNKKINIKENCNKYFIFISLLALFEVVVYVLSFTFVN